MERVLGVLLRRHPDALVGAVSGDAAAALIPVPDGIGVDPAQPRLVGAGISARLMPADQAQIARLWTEARSLGFASRVVRVEGSAEPSTLYLLDFRDEHGVLIVVGAPGVNLLDEHLVPVSDDRRPPARVARIVKDSTATVLAVDEAFERMLGWTAEEIVGSRIPVLVHPDDHEMAVEHWIQMLAFAGASHPVRLRHRHRDGHWIWIEVTNHNRILEHGDVVADMVDVTEEVFAHEAVRARQQLLEQVTEALPIGLLHADDGGRLLYTNQRLTQITGLKAGDGLADWGQSVMPTGESMKDVLAAAASGQPTDTVVEVVDPTGSIRHYSLRVRPFVDTIGSITGITGAVEDVTADVIDRRQLELRAATDSLTGCFNRSATLALAQDALDALGIDGEGPERNGGVAVIFVDVDNLKEINDQFGHAAGDALLGEVAMRLHAAVRARDRVGRFGGDEFVVVLANIRRAEQAMTVARFMASRVTKPFAFDGVPLTLKASVGVAWVDAPGAEATTVIRQADAAMYVSKRDGLGEPVMA